jgi:hypothetical protein
VDNNTAGTNTNRIVLFRKDAWLQLSSPWHEQNWIGSKKYAGVPGMGETWPKWANVGVGKLYHQYALRCLLVDSAGRACFVSDAKADVRQWLPGEYAVTDSLELPTILEPGEYDLVLGLGDPTGTRRPFLLAIDAPEKPAAPSLPCCLSAGLPAAFRAPLKNEIWFATPISRTGSTCLNPSRANASFTRRSKA